MNVNLWGPQLWSLLHGLAYIADSKTALNFQGILDDLRILLPCSLCRNSYCSYYDKFKNIVPDVEAGNAPRRIWELHNLVDDKLEKQRLEKFIALVQPSKKGAMRENFRILSGRPSFEVVLKRGALAEGYSFSKEDIYRVLFSFSMAIEDDTSKPAALQRFVRNLSAMVPNFKIPFLPLGSKKQLFSIFWLSRQGISFNSQTLPDVIDLHRTRIHRSFVLFTEELTAGSCRSK
jgi:hypothetical protein